MSVEIENSNHEIAVSSAKIRGAILKIEENISKLLLIEHSSNVHFLELYQTLEIDLPASKEQYEARKALVEAYERFTHAVRISATLGR